MKCQGDSRCQSSTNINGANGTVLRVASYVCHIYKITKNARENWILLMSIVRIKIRNVSKKVLDVQIVTNVLRADLLLYQFNARNDHEIQ